MTDEEKAEEYAQSEINKMFVDESEEVYVRASTLKQIIKNSHLKGLVEGKTEWHDLRKNPDDLPKVTNSQFLWMCWINPYGNMCYHQGYYDDKGFYWIDEQFCTKYYPVSDIITWCELPEFKE